MKPEDALNYIEQDPVRRGEHRLGQPAGIFLVDGTLHVAPFASRTAAELRERGALHVATLLFNHIDAERSVSGGAPRPRTGAVVRPHPLAALAERPGPN